MYKLTVFFTFLNIFNSITTSYVKKNLDKSNVLNKGTWFKNRVEKGPNFIFPANSLELDGALLNNIDVYGENNVPSPFSSNYIERAKRSPNYKVKSSKSFNEKMPSTINYKSTQNPISILNDFPSEMAILPMHSKEKNTNSLSNSIYISHKDLNSINMEEKKLAEGAIAEGFRNGSSKNIALEDLKVEPLQLSHSENSENFETNVNKTVVSPKYTINKHESENELIKQIEFIEDFNRTDDHKSIKDRNVFNKDNLEWHKSFEPTSVNIYKVIPKSKEDAKKRINERGFLKVLSMLTKTFKKIMKQHSDIKQIHDKLYNLNDDVIKNVDLMAKKFEDFNNKYSRIVKVTSDLHKLEVRINDKELNCDKREKELSKKLTQFENQQKQFLAQQRQFYNVQKVILQQNEQINLKQNMITKTQSEISHRQNNFARILKKGKQDDMASKKLDTTTPKSMQDSKMTTPYTTESVKINLFSIPTVSHLKNQDELILGEKDSQPIDDLIYKFYFNNSFIEDIMKNKILASYIVKDTKRRNNTKSKRHDVKPDTTILVPVNITKSKNRNRRWIRNLKKMLKKEAKRNETKTSMTSSKNLHQNNLNFKTKEDPYKHMAMNFCKEIGQSVDMKILNWCIEKILRKLQVVDLNMPPIQMSEVKKQEIDRVTTEKLSFESKTNKSLGEMVESPSTVVTKPTTANIFFPDNDDVENKLKEYELTPDPEGTVYYDGSLHSSDLGHIFNVDSEGFSDIMPGLDSDSRVQVDPYAIDLQEKRRAEVRKINAMIMKMKTG